MLHNRLFRASRIMFAASAVTMTVGTAALAQTVQVYDEPPPIESLREILVPEAQPALSQPTRSLTRSIVIQRSDASISNSNIQRSAMTTMQSPAPAPMAENQSPAAVSDTPDSRPQVSRRAPHASPALKTGTVGIRINFALNSAELPHSGYAMIDRVVQVMQEAPDIKVQVEGHTDASGAASYNVSLSRRRALSVGEYIVKQGIDPSRLILVGKGMAEPLTANAYDPANRRVQFVRVG